MNSSLQHILTRLDAESSQLFAAFLGLRALKLVGILLILWLATFALQTLVRNVERLPATSRALSHLTLQTMALIASGLLIIWHFYASAPHFVELFVAVTLFAIGVGVSLRLRNWISGLTSIFRGRLRVEDRLTIGNVEGVVISVHPFRITLRNDVGGVVFLPVSWLAQDAFSVASPRHMYPVDVQLELPSPITPEMLVHLRQVGWLCPYRQESSDVFVDIMSEHQHRVTIRFRAWSSHAAERAKIFLKKYAQTRPRAQSVVKAPDGSGRV